MFYASALTLTSLGNRWCLKTMLSCVLFSHWHSSHTLVSISHYMTRTYLRLKWSKQWSTTWENCLWEQRSRGVTRTSVLQMPHLTAPVFPVALELKMGTLNRGQARFFFFPYFRETITLKLRCWCDNRTAMEFSELKASVLFVMSLLPCCIDLVLYNLHSKRYFT